MKADLQAAGIEFDRNLAHSAVYDAEKTADLFCLIMNRWQQLGGWQPRKRDQQQFGLSHITFICQNLEKSAEMLKFVFGANEVYASGDNTFSISREKFFDIADVWICIMEGNAVENDNHVAFKVDDVDLPEFEAKIRQLGLTILPGRKREKSEGNSLYFYDYDNHLFELHSGDQDTRLRFYNAQAKRD